MARRRDGSTRAPGPPAGRALLCTTNGIGLGHLTRAMAVGSRLPHGLTPIVFTTSQAVPVVRAQGFAVEHLPSPGAAPLDQPDWNLLYERRLEELLATYDPAVVAFDGTHPYVGLLRATSRHRRRAFVWVRRAMWQPGLGRESVARAGLFDAVIEPGEHAAPADRGATTRADDGAVRVDPILLCDPGEQRDRTEARAALGLDPDPTWALVQLGAGAINDLSSTLGAAFAALRATPGVRIAFADSTLVAPRDDLPGDVARLRRYPLAADLAAFDVVLTAAGYNTYHEVLAAGVPAVFAPNRSTQLDDQLARARFADRLGVARCWEDGSPETLRRILAALLAPGEAARVRARLQRRPVRNGAGEAAAVLSRQAAARRGEGA
ncbi:UDP-N-acetylglucosamine--LPS N-acetylglucosamine transferase [Egibacter rhizosphaerae]|uniref:UDP-N-acetylglucosamine--LPS N-acetylglucosamine transferase n=1 Tax=Egibacter rhizosphaerae TaxID=1670831 RepID=A0A411YHJ4_9ACTN|nr:glycosyltransferase [Egibacter rhizosphaerae]QBI20687.1 UDP-N-acetylglucosamine--LPS N-acetylglucosamine transferase [Egibacter rhizosphaerae]